MRHHGLKMGQNHWFGHPKWSKITFGKTHFLPFLTHFWSRNGPFSRHFGIFGAQKPATTGSKRAENTCLSIPSGLGKNLEKMIFFALGTLVDPPLAPAVRGPGCPPDPPSEHWYGALGVSLDDFAPPSPVYGAVPGLTMSCCSI